MEFTEQITQQDLTLRFDGRGRLWKFRPANTQDPTIVDAHLIDNEIVVAAAIPGVQPGDVDVQIEGNVLEMTGRAAMNGAVAHKVGLPGRMDLNKVQTVYKDGALEVHLLTATPCAPTAAPATELAGAAC